MVRWLQIGQIRGKLEAFLQDQRGSILTIMVFGLVVTAGLSALAIDMSYLYVLKGRLQMTADFAALAAVAQLPDDDAAHTMALEYAAKNMPAANHGTVLANADVVTGNWDADTRTFTPAGSPINAVRAVTRRSQANGNAAGLFFASILGFNEVDMQTTAIARAGGFPSYCILALESSEQKAVDTGNGTITANGCDVQVNSDNPKQAIAGNPQGDLIADSICVNGAVSPGPTLWPDPQTGCPVVPDPLASLVGPADTDCDYNNVGYNGGTHTLLPGVYCGGINAGGGATLNFEPGDYVIKDGPLQATGGSSLSGDGVSFYLTGNNGILDLRGVGLASLSGPTSGPMAGIVFYADRNHAEGTDHYIKGGAGIDIEGTIYFPTTDLTYYGNATGGSNAAYTMFIGRKLKYNGNGEVTFNSDYANSDVPLPPALGGVNAQLVL